MQFIDASRCLSLALKTDTSTSVGISIAVPSNVDMLHFPILTAQFGDGIGPQFIMQILQQNILCLSLHKVSTVKQTA